MEVVEFKSSDIDVVFAIQQAAYKPLYEKYHDDATNPYTESKETVLQKYTRENTKGYLFLKDGAEVGAVRIALCAEQKSGRVSALAVLPQHQGQGIAQEALRTVEKMHPEVEKWYLDTILQETANCHLYEKLGYKRTGLIEKINEEMTLVSYEK